MTSSRSMFAVPDWTPAQEAIHEDTVQPVKNSTTSTVTRERSMSLSVPWRRRKSSLFNMDDNMDKFKEMSLDRGNGAFSSGEESTQRSLKGLFRRASVTVKAGVKGAIPRRTSVPSIQTRNEGDPDATSYRRPFGSFAQDGHQRPTTSQSTWHRLRQAASFHRHSRFLHTGYDDRDLILEPIESPTFPVPGSGEQPPIIPRNTGAAARQAAASSHVGGYELDESSAPVPKANWLAPDEGGLKDYESGVDIAVTSTDMEAYVPSGDIDSDVDVNVDGAEVATDISKVDFVSQLPTELAIQILAYLDAPTLAIACRVNRHWNHVVANQHVWRDSFLREKTTTYATSGPVKPGTGMGVPALGTRSNWREIYKVKEELDKRWREGKARPVYLNGHSDSIYCLQFDEAKIVTGSRDKTVRVWDMKTYACKLIIGPPEKVNDRDASLLYDGNNKPIHYATLPEMDSSPPYNTEPTAVPRAYESTPALVSYPMHHDASILCLQYDDSILVTGSSDSTCIVYDVKAGYRPIRRLQHHTAAVLDLVFDDKHIVTCSKDISICVWDRETGALLRQLRGHSGPVNAVQMRGNTIVSCSGDFRVKLWNIDTGKNIREFTGHTKGLACTQFSEDGRYVASAGNDKVIRIWDANTGECVREMRAHDNLVRSLHVDSVSGRLISGSYDTDIKVFDMETGRQLLDFPRWHNSWVLSAKSDYRRIVSTGQDPKILIMDFGAGIPGIDMLESTTGRVKMDAETEYI